MKLLFEFAPEKCSACGACAIACMDQNDLDIEAGQQPYRKVYSLEIGGALRSLSVACHHCADAPCVAACPAGVLYKDEETGLTRYDNRNCVGCRLCAQVCPHDAISFRPTGQAHPEVKMEKCHGCLDRVRAGLVPACVHSCPTGALSWRWSKL
jgi:Fe-S-cluster-containing dehydrogenase component